MTTMIIRRRPQWSLLLLLFSSLLRCSTGSYYTYFLPFSLSQVTASSGASNSKNGQQFPIPPTAACRAQNSSRICNPDGFLSQRFVSSLQELITEFEDTTYARYDGYRIDPRLGVYANVIQEDNSSVRERNMLLDAKTKADSILHEWHELEENFNSGILIYLAVHDYAGFLNGHLITMVIARGYALQPVLPDNALKEIAFQVEPFFDHDEIESAILRAIKLLKYQMHESADDDENTESLNGWIMPLCMCLYALATWLRVLLIRFLSSDQSPYGVLQRIRKKVERQLQQVSRSQSTEMLVASGNFYATTKCSICFESFSPSRTRECTNSTHADHHEAVSESTPLLADNDDNPRMRYGSDGKQIVVLPCGHDYDFTCIVKWMSMQLLRNAEPSCPICLAKLEEAPALVV